MTVANLKRALDALQALTEASGAERLSMTKCSAGPMFSVSVATDAAVHAAAVEFGCVVKRAENNGHEWLYAHCDTPYIDVHGPHRPIVQADEVVS